MYYFSFTFDILYLDFSLKTLECVNINFFWKNLSFLTNSHVYLKSAMLESTFKMYICIVEYDKNLPPPLTWLLLHIHPLPLQNTQSALCTVKFN